MTDLQLINIETTPIDPRISGDVVDCLSLAVLGAVLKDQGFQTALFINQYEKNKHTQLLESIARENPKVVGLTTKIFNVRGVEDATKSIAENFPDRKIILGGTQFDGYFSKLFMEKNPQIHAIIRGQGEATLPIVLARLLEATSLNGVAGVTHRQNTDIIVEPRRMPLTEQELEALPTPAFDLIQDITVEKRAGKTVQLRTSAGCNGTCSFCYNQEGGWRGISSEKIVAQMEGYLKMGFRRFLIVDNNFVGNNITRAVNFAKGVLGLRKRYGPVHFQFDARADSFGSYKTGFKHDVLELLVKAGLYDIFTGIESGNAGELEMYGKCRKGFGLDMLEQNRFYLEQMQRYSNRSSVTCGFINFNQNSTAGTVRENLKFVYEYFPPQFAPEVYWYNLSCYVGSRFTKEIQQALEANERADAIEQIMYGEYTPEIRDPAARRFYEEVHSMKPRLRNAYRVFATMLQEKKAGLEADVKSLHKLNYESINGLLDAVERGGSKEELERLKEVYTHNYLLHLQPHINFIMQLAETMPGAEYKSLLEQMSHL